MWRRFGVAVVVVILADVWLIWMADAFLHVDTILNADFRTYWIGARHLIDGAPLYAEEQLVAPYRLVDMDFGIGYVYPPTAAAMSVPLLLLSADVGWAVFSGLGLACLGAAVFVMARREGVDRVAAGATVAVVLFSGPAVQAAIAGNVNLWLGVGLASAWLWPRSASWLAVVGSLVKLYPALGLLWTMRHRAWAWTPIASGTVLGLLVVATFGTRLWAEFIATLTNAQPFGATVPQPPRLVLQPILGPAGAEFVAFGITGVVATAVLLVRQERLAFFLLSLAMILPAQEWTTHYFLIPIIGSLPGLVSLLGPARASRRRASADSLGPPRRSEYPDATHAGRADTVPPE